MPDLEGSRTADHLREAFAAEAQAAARARWSARRAEAEGQTGAAELLRSIAEAAAGRADELLDHLAGAGDPLTGLPVGSAEADLKAAIEGSTRAYTERYPGFATAAREEGFDDLATWFEATERAAKADAGRLTRGLESLA